MVHIVKAVMSHSKEDGYIGKVEFKVEGHSSLYEITLYSKNKKEWGYALNFLHESGKEEEIDAVEQLLEEDELFELLVAAAKASLTA